MVWEEPLYKFRFPRQPNDYDSQDLYEIVLDVTLSAPNSNVPAQNMEKIIQEVFNSHPKISKVLDFGAGKLRITPFLLRQEKSVTAVEFEKTLQTAMTKKNLRKCQGFGGKFRPIIFPKPFIDDLEKYDIVFLFNVPPTMPVSSERLLLLSILYEKLNKDGLILWYSMKEKEKYRNKRESGEFLLGDGNWQKKANRVKSFNKYMNPRELDEIFGVVGLDLEKYFPNGLDDIRLYKKKSHNLISSIVTPEIIRHEISIDNTIEESVELKRVKRSKSKPLIIPNPENLCNQQIYSKILKSLPPGDQYSTQYHRLISYIFSLVFKDSLTGMKLEEGIYNSRKRIDTIYTNIAEKGFFKNIERNKKINSTHIIVEAKNYTNDISNQETDQISGRFSPDTCNIGIIVCRTIKNQKLLLDRCQDYVHKQEFILCLYDSHILRLLELSQNGLDDEISSFMDDRFKELTIK